MCVVGTKTFSNVFRVLYVCLCVFVNFVLWQAITICSSWEKVPLLMRSRYVLKPDGHLDWKIVSWIKAFNWLLLPFSLSYLALYGFCSVNRVSLSNYPFLSETCWLPSVCSGESAAFDAQPISLAVGKGGFALVCCVDQTVSRLSVTNLYFTPNLPLNSWPLLTTPSSFSFVSFSFSDLFFPFLSQLFPFNS